MKIHSNIEEYSKQFQKYIEEVQRKMKGMVREFSINVTLSAINQTPYGVQNDLYLSQARASFGLEPIPGHARGGWIVGLNSFDKSDYGNRAKSENSEEAYENAKSKLQGYQLGQDVYISNNIPYVASEGFTVPRFGSLENGYSSQASTGITAPTLDLVFNIYQLNLKEYYDES